MRTFFFSFSSPTVFKNLFFFPGSLYDRIKTELGRDPSLRVVFLFPEREYEKFLPFFEADLSDQIICEKVALPPFSLAQKLFLGFSSYLIYTGTTWVLAQTGTRPDDPPGFGVRALAPLKRALAATFGSSRRFKVECIPAAWRFFFREHMFAALFKRYHPERVFISHLYGTFDARLLGEANAAGIFSLGMAAAWDHLDKYYFPIHLDRILVQNGQMRRAALTFQSYEAARVVEVGYPHFDFLVDERRRMTEPELFRVLRLPQQSRYIVYVSGSAYCPDEPDVIEEMLRWIEEGRLGRTVYLVIRPYVGRRGTDKEFDMEKFNRFRGHDRVRFYDDATWGAVEQSTVFANMLRYAGVVLAMYSTAILEAAVYDRPLVAIAFDGYKTRPYHRSIRRFLELEHFKDVIRAGALRIAHSFPELFFHLASYLANPELDREHRRSVQEDLCFRLDGKAGERIAHELFSSHAS